MNIRNAQTHAPLLAPRNAIATQWTAAGIARNVLAVLIGTASWRLQRSDSVDRYLSMRDLAVVSSAGAWSRSFLRLLAVWRARKYRSACCSRYSGAGVSGLHRGLSSQRRSWAGWYPANRLGLARWRCLARDSQFICAWSDLADMTGMGAPLSAAVLGAGIIPFIRAICSRWRSRRRRLAPGLLSGVARGSDIRTLGTPSSFVALF